MSDSTMSEISRETIQRTGAAARLITRCIVPGVLCENE